MGTHVGCPSGLDRCSRSVYVYLFLLVAEMVGRLLGKHGGDGASNCSQRHRVQRVSGVLCGGAHLCTSSGMSCGASSAVDGPPRTLSAHLFLVLCLFRNVSGGWHFPSHFAPAPSSSSVAAPTTPCMVTAAATATKALGYLCTRPWPQWVPGSINRCVVVDHRCGAAATASFALIVWRYHCTTSSLDALVRV